MLTSTAVFEVEPRHSWREGARQVLAYSAQYGLPRALALFHAIPREEMLTIFTELRAIDLHGLHADFVGLWSMGAPALVRSASRERRETRRLRRSLTSGENAMTPSSPLLDVEHLALAALTWLAEDAEPRHLRPLTQAHGSARTLAMITAGQFPADLAPQARAALGRSRRHLRDVPGRDELAAIFRSGIRLVCPGDDEWPSRLDDLGDDTPIALWARGAARLGEAAGRSVSIIGSRAASAYGTAVVEAGRSSGSMHAARDAAELGRPLMAVPGPVTSTMSGGRHQLIRHGDAVLVTCGADVIETLTGREPKD